MQRGPRCRTPEQARERRLAHCERVAPQIVAVEFDQVEGIEEHARVVTPIPDAVEGRDPVIATCHRFAVDDAGARAQLGDCLDNEREAVGRNRLTWASSIAVTSARVALEKNRVGLKMISGPAETPSD